MVRIPGDESQSDHRGVAHRELLCPEGDPPQVLQPTDDPLNGLITNDKFCLTRTGRLQLSWPRARWAGRAWPARHPPDEVTHRGGEHAGPATARVARAADRRAGGHGGAALGPGLPAPPAVGDTET